MIDCLMIGHNDGNFADYVKLVRAMGENSGAYRDLKLAFIDLDGKPYRALDVLSHYYPHKQRLSRPFNNTDFLWPTLLVLGSFLAKHRLTFDYVNLFQFERDKLKEKLLGEEVLAIAITTTLYVTPQPILEIIAFIRRYNPKPKIIVGGPYIGNQTVGADAGALRRLFQYIGADFYVDSSEGESALVNILTALKQDRPFDGIDNIAYKQGDGYVITTRSTEYNPLEENPVDYDLFPAAELNEFVSVRTAKSCPFSCAFCGFPTRAGQYQYLAVEQVERELDTLHRRSGISTITFLDDTFNVPKGRFKELLRMMIRNGYDFKWNCFYRSDHGDDETIDLMAKAGCEGVFLGLESGSNTVLAKMNKSARREDYLKAIPRLRQVGIISYASLIIGFPGETFATVQETTDLIETTQPDFFRAQLWYADPLTPVWKQRESLGIRGSAFNWVHDTMDAESASDMIEWMFLGIQNSVWLPQYGFEPWSVYYLRRKGMSLTQVKALLRAFNAVVKESLLCPGDADIRPRLLEDLRAACRFGDTTPGEAQTEEVFPAAAYRAAEHYCLTEFGDGLPACNIEAMDRQDPAGASDLAVVECAVDAALLSRLAVLLKAEPAAIGLAAYSVLLARLNGREDTVIVAAMASAAPLRLRPCWDVAFVEFLAVTQRKLEELGPHEAFLMRILTSPLWRTRHGRQPPVFDAAFAFSAAHQGESAAGDPWRRLRQSYPAIYQGFRLVLEVNAGRDRLILRFAYDSSRFREETMMRLAGYWAAILEGVAATPAAAIGDLRLEGGPNAGGTVSGAPADHAAESFNF